MMNAEPEGGVRCSVLGGKGLAALRPCGPGERRSKIAAASTQNAAPIRSFDILLREQARSRSISG